MGDPNGGGQRRVQFGPGHVVDVQRLVLAGFALFYMLDELELDVVEPRGLIRAFLTTVRNLRADMPADRMFLVMDSLHELHGDADRANLQTLLEEMRKYL